MSILAPDGDVVVLTPGGQISRYIYGLDFSATDLRLSLVEAAAQRIGGLVEQVLLVGSALFWLRRSERVG